MDEAERRLVMSEELLKKLREQLPADCFDVVNETLATYYDFHGVSFGESKTEQAVIGLYIAEMIERKVGYPVSVIREDHAGNGHFAVNFVRAAQVTKQK